MRKLTCSVRGLSALAAVFLSFPLHAAPGGTLTDIDHGINYPTPQNLMAELDGSRVRLSWDGVRWPADGFPEEIDGLADPTDFCYEIWCRKKVTGTDDWGDWWHRTSQNRLDANGAFISRLEIMDDVETGKTYQYKIRCVQYVRPENPIDLPEDQRTQDVYRSEYSDPVTAYRTLDKLEIALSRAPAPSLTGTATIDLSYNYTSHARGRGRGSALFYL